MSRRKPRVEWILPGWRVDHTVPGASPGIVLGVTRDRKAKLRMGATQRPSNAVTFGWLHTLTADGSDNVLCLPGFEEYVGLSDPAATRAAITAWRRAKS